MHCGQKCGLRMGKPKKKVDTPESTVLRIGLI
jgi:hypothetical protein